MGDPYPFQITGSEFLSERPRALLADDMGLGKTMQAIRAWDRLGARQVVVVCPASVRPVWYDEAQQWSLFDPELHVYSYAELVSNQNTLARVRQLRPDVLIGDEIHYAKSPKAKRSRVFYRLLAPQAEHVWGLTGTPAPKNIADLWTHARFLGRETLSYGDWANHFAVTAPSDYWPGWRVVRHRLEKRADLHQRLKSWFLRRRLQDVEAELPPIRWGMLWVDPGDVRLDPPRDVLEEQAKLRTLLDAAKGDEEAEQILRSQIPHLAKLRRYTGVAKVAGSPLLQEINDELPGMGGKVLLFGHHRDVLDTAAEFFGHRAVVLHGGTSPRARRAAVQRFQEGDAEVFIGQTQAAGEGLTLTAAHHCIFLEPSWVPKDLAQAAKRVHRITQTKSVLIRVAALMGSIEEVIARVVTRRAREIGAFLSPQS